MFQSHRCEAASANVFSGVYVFGAERVSFNRTAARPRRQTWPTIRSCRLSWNRFQSHRCEAASGKHRYGEEAYPVNIVFNRTAARAASANLIFAAVEPKKGYSFNRTAARPRRQTDARGETFVPQRSFQSHRCEAASANWMWSRGRVYSIYVSIAPLRGRVGKTEPRRVLRHGESHVVSIAPLRGRVGKQCTCRGIWGEDEAFQSHRCEAASANLVISRSALTRWCFNRTAARPRRQTWDQHRVGGGNKRFNRTAARPRRQTSPPCCSSTR